jgi:hypothetical protein
MNSLVCPAAAMFFWILGVGMFVIFTRISYFRKGLVKGGYYLTLDATKYDAPEFLVRAGRHYDNLFQLPMLYFGTIALGVALNLDSALAMGAAWAFVATRAVHTFIHLTSNHVMRRMFSFLAGWVCLTVMWIAILIR